MLFMGEEFAASTPFLYFCDFGGELARAVSTGRRAEFGRFAAFADPAAQARIPDPIALTTFERSRLLWPERSEGDHARRLELVRRLLALRRERLVPLLGDGLANGRFAVAGSAFRVDWTLADGSRWWMHANLARHEHRRRPAGRRRDDLRHRAGSAAGAEHDRARGVVGVDRQEHAMTVDTALLHRLCARHGIETGYRDIWGHAHQAAPESLVLLLDQLGVDAGSNEAAAAAERRDDELDRRRLLEPVAAVAADREDWSLAVGSATGEVAWTLSARRRQPPQRRGARSRRRPARGP